MITDCRVSDYEAAAKKCFYDVFNLLNIYKVVFLVQIHSDHGTLGWSIDVLESLSK